MSVTVNRLVIMLDLEVCKYAPNLPVCYKHNKTAELLQSMSNAVKYTLKGMGLFARFKEQKMYYLNEAYTEIDHVQTIFLEFNMLGVISNDTKARFDIKIDDIRKNYSRLLCSLEKELCQCSCGALHEESHIQKET